MFNCTEPCACSALIAPQRNHYFYGKLLDERSLLDEQRYLNQKRWMLNRLSLGKGVLCGLTVTWTDDRIGISPGVAIDGCGREIVVPEPVTINPWQTTDDRGLWVPSPLPSGGIHEVYLCLAYVECPTDFTPVLVTDCDTVNGMAPSTIVEKYAFLVKEVASGAPQSLPPALDEKLCAALSGPDAETKREEVSAVLAKRACADGESTPCVVIVSKVTLTDGKITAVDVCGARPMAYSNPALFEMMLCRSGGGAAGPKGDTGPGIDRVTVTPLDCKADPTAAIDDTSEQDTRILALGIPRGCDGADGKDGLGLHSDLPKILDIGWTHDALYDYLARLPGNPPSYEWSFVKPFRDETNTRFLTVADDQPLLIDRIIKGENAPPFTIYFNRKLAGIDPQTLTVRFKLPLVKVVSASPLVVEPLGVYFEFEIYGDILSVDVPASVAPAPTTPHTGERYPYAASFIPHQNFYSFLPILLYLGQVGTFQKKLAPPTFSLCLKGDFVWAPGENNAFDEKAVLDADNIGARVGLNMARLPPVRGGKNPSGNLTQGGDFESWFRLQLGRLPIDDPAAGASPVLGSHMMNAIKTQGMNLSAMPVSVNLASMSELTDAGLTKAQATAIIRERQQGWFSNHQDILKRAKLSDAVVRKMQSKIIAL